MDEDETGTTDFLTAERTARQLRMANAIAMGERIDCFVWGVYVDSHYELKATAHRLGLSTQDIAHIIKPNMRT